MSLINDGQKKHKARGLNKFCKLTARERRRMCYAPLSLIAEVFPTGIEKLKANSMKPQIDTIQVETKHALVQSRVPNTNAKSVEKEWQN